MDNYINSILKEDEKVIVASSVSKSALLVIWLSIPAVFMAMYLPAVISAIASAAKSADRAVSVLAFLGVDLAGLLEAAGVSRAISVFVAVVFTILVITWIIIALFFTRMHLGYKLVLTDQRIVGKAKNEDMDVTWDKVKNVTISHTWIERLFKYGTVTIVTKHYSRTFQCMSKPNEIKRVIFDHICDM